MVRSTARTYYEALSIAETASAAEIERAFRRVCFIHFSDSQDDVELAERLLPVAEACYILSHPHLRGDYDRDGEPSLDAAELHCRAVGVRDAALVRLRPAAAVRDGAGWVRGVSPVVVTAIDLLHGIRRTVGAPCRYCDGVGWLPVAPVPCPTCAATVPARRALSPALVRMGVVRGCGGCYDRGYIAERACPSCSGSGVDRHVPARTIAIPAGTAPGAEIVAGAGAGGWEGSVAIVLEPDPRFRLEGRDLVADLPITRAELAGGGSRRFEGIAETIEIVIPAGADWGYALRIPGAGLPAGADGRRGDLVLNLIPRQAIVMPPERRYRRRNNSPLGRRLRAARRRLSEVAELARRRFREARARLAGLGGTVVRRPSVAIAAVALVLTAGAAVGSLARGPRPEPVVAIPDIDELTASPAGPAAPVRSARTPPSGDAAGLRIEAIAGGGQSGAAGEPLADSIAVRLVEADGRPLVRRRVSFVVLTGRGSISPRSAVTDSLGVARTRWTLGPTEALQAVAAMAEDNSLEAVVTARLSGAEAARAALVSGADQSAVAGEPLDRPVQVRVEDRDGRPAQGVRVTFRAGQDGRVSPQEATTDAQGIARTEWRLGPRPGEQRLRILPGSAEPIELSARALPAPLPVRAGIATGGTHTCRLFQDGTLACWGGNASGQLGDGRPRGRSAPTVANGHLRFAAVAGGVAHTCALRADGAAFCWGSGAQGQLGDGRFDDVAKPQEVAGGPYRAIAAGSSHSCALDADGFAYCWGGNESGQLGDGSTRVGTAPRKVAGDTRFAALALGWSHSCALDLRGLAHCWGRNAMGQLGTGDLRDRARPATVAGRHVYRALVAGSAHTCGLTRDGVAYCWGHDDQGQLGDAAAGADRSAPVRVRAPVRFVRLTAGSVHTCGLTADGAAYCWGGNAHGQLGDGSTAARATPVSVLGGHRFRTLHASGAHTCATDEQGRDYCWGYNMEGQIGDGTRTDRAVPTRVTADGPEAR